MSLFSRPRRNSSPRLAATYHPSGQLSSVTYSNGLTYTATFNTRQLMTGIRVDAGSTARMRYSYGRDALGRVTSITDHVVSGENHGYRYDALGRLTSASGPWGSGAFTYDLLNNLHAKTLRARTVTLQSAK